MKNLFLSMMALALVATPVFAEENGYRKEERRSDSSAYVPLDATQLACVKTAITKREDALIAGHDIYALAVKNAYTARKTALLLAWDKTDRTERRTAVRSADKAFKDSVRGARTTWQNTRRATWKTFETERKACAPQAQLSSTDTGSSKEEISL
jgi:hypothetical protein